MTGATRTVCALVLVVFWIVPLTEATATVDGGPSSREAAPDPTRGRWWWVWLDRVCGDLHAKQLEACLDDCRSTCEYGVLDATYQGGECGSGGTCACWCLPGDTGRGVRDRPEGLPASCDRDGRPPDALDGSRLRN